MARYKHLEIYQQGYRLSKEIYRVKKKLPKATKYDLGEMAMSSSIKILRGIIVANGSKDKLKFIQIVSLEIEVMWIYLRLLFDFEGISHGEFRDLSTILSELSKLNNNWQIWANKEQSLSKTKK